MKAVIPYYGGKVQMLKHILPLVPKFKTYCEPFCGGGSLFFAINKSFQKNYILNDINSSLVNLYSQMKLHKEEVIRIFESFLVSRELYKEAKSNIYDKTPLSAAYYLYVLSTSYFSDEKGGFKCINPRQLSHKPAKSLAFLKKKLELLCKEIEYAMIDNSDAFEIIKKIDNERTFFYIDPPYPGAEQKYRQNFSQEELDNLLHLLYSIKGKFLLSCFSHNVSTVPPNINFKEITLPSNMKIYQDTGREKKELLVYNYDVERTLFD